MKRRLIMTLKRIFGSVLFQINDMKTSFVNLLKIPI